MQYATLVNIYKSKIVSLRPSLDIKNGRYLTLCNEWYKKASQSGSNVVFNGEVFTYHKW